MILGTLENSKRIELLHPAFKTLFEYVKSHNFLKEKETCVKLDGDNLYINNSESELRDKREIQLIEVHRKYIDVHIPLDKMETIGWKPLSKLAGEKDVYNEEKDFIFYEASCDTYIDVWPGQFLIIYPEDGHAPIIGKGKIRKLCAKVRIIE